MTESQNGTSHDAGPGGADARTGEQTVEAIVATVDAVQTGLREGQDTAAAVAQQWASRLAGLPFTALTGGGLGPVVSGQVWVDSTVEMVDAVLAVQRRSVERLVSAQCRAAGLLAESGLALTAAGWRAVGGAAGTPPDRTAS